MSEEINKKIFDAIAKNDIGDLKSKLSTYNGSVDFTDDNGKPKKLIINKTCLQFISICFNFLRHDTSSTFSLQRK